MVQLFCFPYAGGSADLYRKWGNYLDDGIQLRPIELAGRGKRVDEPLYGSVPEMIEDVYQLLQPELMDQNFAFLGHSMGGMIAYELAKKLHTLCMPLPVHLFISGRSAPHLVQEEEKKFHQMPDHVFKKEVKSLVGTPPNFFDHPELVDFYLPLLKNDFMLGEANLYTEPLEPLPIPMTVFAGKNDEITKERILDWDKFTVTETKFHFLKGGHFFLHNRFMEITRIINQSLN